MSNDVSPVPIVCPAVHYPDITPCDPSELEPIIQRLSDPVSVTQAEAFPRGTLLPDGRLDLCKQSVGPAGAAWIADAACRTPHVRSLLLGTGGIGDPGARALADAIIRNERSDAANLDVLYLGCNGITADGVNSLCDAMDRRVKTDARDADHPSPVHPSFSHGGIRGLWLKRNPIGDAGVVRIAQSIGRGIGIETLDLFNVGMTREGLNALRDVMVDPARRSHLQHLYLGGNGLTGDDALPMAEIIRGARDGQPPRPTLQSLHLSVGRLGDRGAVRLADVLDGGKSSLTSLSIASNGLGDVGMTALFDAVTAPSPLRRLDLGYAPSTRVLGASPNRVTAASAGSLSRCIKSSSLDYFNLMRTGAVAMISIIRPVLNRRGRPMDLRIETLPLRHSKPIIPPHVRAIQSVYRK